MADNVVDVSVMVMEASLYGIYIDRELPYYPPFWTRETVSMSVHGLQHCDILRCFLAIDIWLLR